MGAGVFLPLSARCWAQSTRRIKAAVALSDRKSDDTGRADRRGAGGGGVARGELEVLLTLAVTDSGFVLDVADAFKLVGTGLPLGGMGPEGAAVMPGRRNLGCSPGCHHR